MDHHQHTTLTSRAEAERLLGIAEKLLRNKDLTSSKDFAILAQETEPLLEGPEQILAIIEVLLAADKRLNNQHDWYSILQLAPRTEDFELIKKQYRRLALFLHPDKNKFPFADSAFHLVADAWAVLSDPGKKSVLDNELTLFTKVDLVPTKKNKETPTQRQANKSRQGNFSGNKSGEKLPVRRGSRGETGGYDGNAGGGGGDGASGAKRGNPSAGSGGLRSGNFWTACPYCYNLYEYPRVYEGCCLKCQNCTRAFTAVGVVAMPPTVPGKEAYYCCWGVFPMGFSASGESGGGFANWAPPMSSAGRVANGGGRGQRNVNVNSNANVRPAAQAAPAAQATPAAQAANSAPPVKRGRGRPRKNP